MKQKTLLLTLVLLASTFFTLSAQEVLVSENFSSQDWQDEIARLNPGADEFGVLINPNATNIAEYTPGATYTNINAIDLYFDKYLLSGAIEAKEAILPCPLEGHSHTYNNQADIAFRFQNTAAGLIEFPELTSAGLITLHIRNGNSGNPTTIALEKLVDDVWTWVYTFDLQNNSAYDATDRDEIVTYNIDMDGPVKLRLVNNVASAKRFINLYEVEILSKAPNSVRQVMSNPFKIAGRTLIAEQPTKISVYNMIGVVVLEKTIQSQIEIPASIGNGVFMVKSDLGIQKVFLK